MVTILCCLMISIVILCIIIYSNLFYKKKPMNYSKHFCEASQKVKTRENIIKSYVGKTFKSIIVYLNTLY